MMREKQRLKGMVCVTVFGADGKVKKRRKGFLRRLLHLEAKDMKTCHHNTITSTGDALIADLLLSNPTLKKADSSNGYIAVGTGWTGSGAKSNKNVNKAAGKARKLDEGYPKLEGSFGSDGDNVLLYRASFAAGELEANGINEAALMNGTDGNAFSLAYAQITPSVNVTTSDSLQIDWQITVCGS